MNDAWETAQKWELNWHGSCINSLYEEQKQLVYAEKMGLIRTPTPKTPYVFDLQGKSILDIGGGAYSLLLKCVNFKTGKLAGTNVTTVADSLMNDYPQWVRDRYAEAGIVYWDTAGEELGKWEEKPFDECWIYNVLEHTYSPKKIIENALELGKVIRIFEWLDTPSTEGHPQTLRENELNEWLGGTGKTEIIKRGGASGHAYYGVFKGNHYE